jgi:hypothetical protein
MPTIVSNYLSATVPTTIAPYSITLSRGPPPPQHNLHLRRLRVPHRDLLIVSRFTFNNGFHTSLHKAVLNMPSLLNKSPACWICLGRARAELFEEIQRGKEVSNFFYILWPNLHDTNDFSYVYIYQALSSSHVLFSDSMIILTYTENVFYDPCLRLSGYGKVRM